MVAIVNGTPITQAEYVRYLMLKPTVTVQSNRGPQEAAVSFPLGFQALNDIVKQKLVVQMAKQEGVYPSDADLNKEIDFRKENDPNWVPNLQRQGLDLGMIKEALAVEMSRDNLIGKDVTVTDADIDQYKKMHPAEFMKPASMDLQWILVSSEAAKKQVDSQLSNGQRFDLVAQQFSEFPGARDSRGAYPTNDPRRMSPDLLKVVNKLEPLHSSDWQVANGSQGKGWAKFYLVKKTNAEPIEYTDHVKEMVRRRIRTQKGSGARDLGTEIMSQEKTGKIEVKMSGLQNTWDAYLKQLNGTAPSVGAANASNSAAPAATKTGSTTGK